MLMPENELDVRGLEGLVERPGAPAILELEATDPVDAITQRLGSGPQARLRSKLLRRRDDDGVLQLLQPINDVVYFAAVEVVCLRPGEPRLDPRSIESAGLVVRRKSGGDRQGWLREGGNLRGWCRLDDELLDPEPERRPIPSAGHEVLNRQLAALRGDTPVQESSTSLFTAPAQVCEAAGKTVLYGMIPVSDAESSRLPPDAVEYAADKLEILKDRVPPFFRKGGPRQFPTAIQGRSVNIVDDVRELESFVGFLRQVKLEYDAFGDSRESRALFDELNKINLVVDDRARRSAGDFLKEAADVLLDPDESRSSSPRSVLIPRSWPELSEDVAETLFDLILASLKRGVSGLAQGEARFSDAAAQYQARAFIRARHAPECPLKTYWSKYSDPFRIAPWYESGDTPPVRIAMPNPFDGNFVKKLKPNVAFDLPADLFNFLNSNDPSEILADGEIKEGEGPSIGFLCSLNLPIITICALILLYIVLQLLHIVFYWLPFVKICIPSPRE